MIEVSNLQLSMSGKPILSDLSFSVQKGQKAVLYGESGSGKTSLMRCLIGLYRAQAGEIRIDDKPLTSVTIPEIREQLCYLPQGTPTFDDETALEFFQFPFTFRKNRHLRPPQEKIFELLEKLTLSEDLLGQSMVQMSGGERQRMALVRALLLKRKILLLDEATSAIDSENRDRVMDLIFKDPDLTLLAVSHDKAWIKASEPRFEIKKGRMILSGEERGTS